MGRLKKKKKSSGKKKKKALSNQPLSHPESRDVKLSGSSAVAIKEKKKRLPTAVGKTSSKSPQSPGKKRKNYLDMAMQFLREVIMELKKVTWPSRKQTTGSTIVMIILVMIISLFLGVVDVGLYRLIRIVF